MSRSPDELEQIKQRRMADMRRRMAEEDRGEQVKQEMEVQKQNLLRTILSPEARSRLNNLKMVRPDFADQLELQLIQLAQQGKLPIPLTDDELKRILIELQNRKRDIRITRI
ncbi:MAG: DNA-binding protein [Candidatus Methanomethyliaceae archaeon]|nr:DNA-binding protein [Candidatus Methanomethyliaceae archaeon]